MPIATRCTCGQSLIYSCMAGIMECNELFHHKADNGYEDNIEPIKIDMQDKKRYTAEEALNLQAAAYQKGFNEGYEPCKKGGGLNSTLRESIEDILLKTGKHNQEECSELADAIIRDTPRGTGAVWVKASTKPAELLKPYYCKLKSNIDGHIFKKIVLITLDGQWQSAWDVVEWLDESNEQPVEQGYLSFNSVISSLEYYQGVIAGLADGEDNAFTKGVHYQRIGMLHEAIETIKNYSQVLKPAPIEQKENEAVDVDELWDEHSILIGDDIDDLSYWSGKEAIKKEDFIKAIQQYKKQNEQ
jgi:hypothetical protein